jgi:hypothetical protein
VFHIGHGGPVGGEMWDWQRGYIETFVGAVGDADWADPEQAKAAVIARMKEYEPTGELLFPHGAQRRAGRPAARRPQRPAVTPAWPWSAELEGTVAAPRSHRVLLETPAIRVLEIVGEPEHVHRSPSVMIVDGPARIRYYQSGVLTFESPLAVDRGAVRAMWMDPEGPHAVENIDTHAYHAFRVELLS